MDSSELSFGTRGGVSYKFQFYHVRCGSARSAGPPGIVPAGAAIGLGWGIAEGYGIIGIIGLALLGGFIGAMIALIKEKIF